MGITLVMKQDFILLKPTKREFLEGLIDIVNSTFTMFHYVGSKLENKSTNLKNFFHKRHRESNTYRHLNIHSIFGYCIQVLPVTPGTANVSRTRSREILKWSDKQVISHET